MKIADCDCEKKNAADLNVKNPLLVAFPYTIPVMTGYIFMGSAFGILLESQGYNFLWAALMSISIYGGSIQFVAVTLLASAFAPLNALLISLIVNSRHMFYGFSMLDRFKQAGRSKYYLIFGMTDETFSLLCSLPTPSGISQRSFYLSITFLNHCYWIIGSVSGSLLGSSLSFNTKGIDFVMTALFVAIFVEQWRTVQNRWPALTGLLGSAICLIILGPEHFMLPAMAILVIILTLGRAPLEKILMSAK